MVKTFLVLLLLAVISSVFLTYFMYQDYQNLKTEKIIFLQQDEQTLELADRYVIFNAEKTNLTTSEIVKEYWKGDINIYPETILFKAIKFIK